MTNRAKPVDVIACEGGPLLLRGVDVVVDENGVRHQVDRPVVALCRCERSSSKPWCDGTHKLLRHTNERRTDDT